MVDIGGEYCMYNFMGLAEPFKHDKALYGRAHKKKRT
jgi:hypothetical protein